MIFPAAPVCFLVPLLVDMCAGLLRMASPILLKSTYGMRDSEVGIAIGTATVLYTGFSFYGGRAADRWGALNAIKVGLFLVVLNAIVFSFVRSKGGFLLCTITMPVGHGFFWPAFQAWIGHDVDRTETARRLGLFSIGFSLGLCAIGPYVSGLALEMGPAIPFYLGAILAILLFLFFQLGRPELLRHEVHATGVADEFIPREERRRFLVMARIGILGAVASMTVLQTFIPLVGLDWKLSESSLGSLVSVLGVALSLTFIVLALTSRWHYRRTYLIGGQLLGVFGLLILGVGGALFLPGEGEAAARMGVALSVPALALAGIMCGICYFSSSFYAIFGEEQKGKNSGIHEGIIGIANVVALYGGGAAVYLIGKMSPYWLSAMFIGVLLLVQIRVFRKGRQP